MPVARVTRAVAAGNTDSIPETADKTHRARGRSHRARGNERGVSFLLAGERDVDLSLAVEKIGERFGVQTLMLEGGGRINGLSSRTDLSMR